MKLLQQFWLSIVLLVLALLASISYQVIGISIDSNGLLNEPFGLIPVAWLCLFSAIFSAAVTLFRRDILKR
ncbi:DUF3955 domain-containing protein [Shewanella kaireitica]|uniref:DUF3955 domain-containing protein n=1 Tax=Shewanella kaireitica TaxID=212021 RepID=UPI00200E72BB|nr:DUF3955 domain-containing protein [Shewanella kaireitica]MCL1094029.1 DUF3955 domain-containing protein [Shewanella kaireitica]